MVNNVALENLVRLGQDGRPGPWVADRWVVTPSRAVRLHIRPNTRFHDGTILTPAVLAPLVQKSLASSVEPAAVTAVSDSEIEIVTRKPSSLVLESLDLVTVRKPEARDVGTGPFSVTARGESVELQAYGDYPGGRPAVDRLSIRNYATVRSAWADMLRGQIDMLYEVGLDALGSLEPSSKVSLFWFQRPLEYIVLLNTRRPALKSPEIRKALNLAIDRAQLVHEALDDHGTPGGAVSPRHWAYGPTMRTSQHDPSAAAKAFRKRLHLTCIFPDGPLYERLALTVQKQLRAVGVDMDVQAVPLQDLSTRVRERGDFDAVLFDAQVGPTMYRAYEWWHSGGPKNFGGFSSATIDGALDAIRSAANDTEYAAGVAAFQRAAADDPPAIFLAWGDRARAVSRRFEVPVEPGRDVMGFIRLWKLAPGEQIASRN